MADLSKQMNHISVCVYICFIFIMITYVENTAPPHLQQKGDPVSPILDQLGYPMIVLWPHPVFVGKCTTSTCTLCRWGSHFARDPTLELTKWCAFNFRAWLVVEDFVLVMGLLAISGSQDIGLDSTKAGLVAARWTRPSTSCTPGWRSWSQTSRCSWHVVEKRRLNHWGVRDTFLNFWDRKIGMIV